MADFGPAVLGLGRIANCNSAQVSEGTRDSGEVRHEGCAFPRVGTSSTVLRTSTGLKQPETFVAKAQSKKTPARWRSTGHGQLTLVEHALCPLDPEASLTENLIHTAEYHFTDSSRHQQTARARVFCPLGLSASDELFLWGLLSLTLSQPEPEIELHATPHYCLRQLGLIDQHARRGGRQYQQFADSLARLGAVVYQNDRFYDPIRGEHRSVSFGFLSYSLPLDPASSRAWRIAWNGLFFELVQAAAGSFRFDLHTYRELDPASRRLFLLLSRSSSAARQAHGLTSTTWL
jgi:hypothetical protein